MLVHFHKGITLEGETTVVKRKHFWSRPEEFREKIYCHTAVSGICDDAEVNSEIDRLVSEQKTILHGWGKDFSGWQRTVDNNEMPAIAEKAGWANVRINKLIIEPVSNWTMEEILKKLTGKQFAQFCKDCDITLKDIKEVQHYV